MLIVTRKIGQGIRIELSPEVDPRTPIGEIFAQGPINVTIAYQQHAHIRLGIEAPSPFLILRSELTTSMVPVLSNTKSGT